ncbi:hypothetical protein [Streptomyces sp. NPDC001508]|uniref:hypothetical protein n=1 Tax=Streptomyces sp. NPDC001508 TaxID=3154656 RepID=UPI0033273787
MTENQTNLSSDTTAPVGSEANPIVVDVRPFAPDAVDTAIASTGAAVGRYEAAFRSSADLSANLPADLRQIVSEAASAITSTLATANNGRIKADDFRADVRLYPEGREMLASEALKAARDKVSQSFEDADARLLVADASLYEAARPRLSAEAAMPARADLQMMTQRHMGSPATLADVLKRFAQRGDAVGALVADSTYLGDFLAANGLDPEVSDSIRTVVRAEVVNLDLS